MESSNLSQPVADNLSRMVWSECDTTPFIQSINNKTLLVADASKFCDIARSDAVTGYNSILLLVHAGRVLGKEEQKAIHYLSNEKFISVKVQEFKVVAVNSDTDVFRLCNVKLVSCIVFGVASNDVSKIVTDNCNVLSNGVFIFTPKAN